MSEEVGDGTDVPCKLMLHALNVLETWGGSRQSVHQCRNYTVARHMANRL